MVSNPGGQVRAHTAWESPERQGAEAERQTMASHRSETPCLSRLGPSPTSGGQESTIKLLAWPGSRQSCLPD